jgi:molybdopterin synthase catalytic subunit
VVAEPVRISVALSSVELDQAEGIRFVADPRAGGVAMFAGVTRSVTDDRQTDRLSYEAYPELAEQTLEEIAEEICERLELCAVWVRHRTGVVPAAGPSVIIVVSAPHRAEAFEACRYIIDELKERAPIWKKEHFADGSEEWVRPKQIR